MHLKFVKANCIEKSVTFDYNDPHLETYTNDPHPIRSTSYDLVNLLGHDPHSDVTSIEDRNFTFLTFFIRKFSKNVKKLFLNI